MVRVVGVRFKKAGKVYYFDPAEYPIALGAKVVVETARGVEYGEVAVGPKDVTEDQVVQPLKKVVRLGSEKDAVVAAENKRKEKESFSIAQKKIETHSLEMTLVDVEYTFDGSKIIFYFTAEGRVDFRELVRDLASVFRTRIEMRQIGVRDEAKLLGGIGPCGRILCCTSFLGDFAPVSIRMAKDQNLSLNPSKISGLCGRLMCCLRYEQETYEAAKKDPTLSPGYVPPVLTEVADNLEDLEDRPTPAIGFRNNRGELSARIAQAAGLTERPQQRREERPPERRGGGGERPQQGERQLPRQEAQGGGRPDGRPRPQGHGAGPRREHEPRQQGERQGQPQGQDRRGQQPRPQHQGPGKPQGERQQPKSQLQSGPQQPRQHQQPRKGNQNPQPPGQRPQGDQPRREEKPEGNNEQQNRHQRHRRRGGEKPQRNPNPGP